MIDAGNFNSRETLKNGLQVTVRAVRPDDKDAILAAFRKLDERSVYLRFFEQRREIPPEELRAVTVVDSVRIIALVTCIQDGPGEKIIGEGRYIVFGNAEPPDRAEIAFAVEDDFQGLGIASMTLRHLTRIAKEKGITQFHAEVLRENKEMLAVFNRCGFPVKQECAEGLVHVTLSLAG